MARSPRTACILPNVWEINSGIISCSTNWRDIGCPSTVPPPVAPMPLDHHPNIVLFKPSLAVMRATGRCDKGLLPGGFNGKHAKSAGGMLKKSLDKRSQIVSREQGCRHEKRYFGEFMRRTRSLKRGSERKGSHPWLSFTNTEPGSRFA